MVVLCLHYDRPAAEGAHRPPPPPCYKRFSPLLQITAHAATRYGLIFCKPPAMVVRLLQVVRRRGSGVCYLGRRALLPGASGSAAFGSRLCYLGRRFLLPWTPSSPTLGIGFCCLARPALLPWAPGSATLGAGVADLAGRRCCFGRLLLLPWASAFAALHVRRCYLGRQALLPWAPRRRRG